MKQQNREGFAEQKHSLWGKAKMSFNKLIKRLLARFIAGICISAFFFMSIVAVLLPINASYAQTKNISVTTENHVKTQNINTDRNLRIRHISVMPNQRTVRSKGKYMFTKRPVLLVVTVDGIDASTIKRIHKVYVNIGRYKVANSKAELAKTEVLSSLVNFRYQLRPNPVGVVKVELKSCGIYDLRDVSVRIASVAIRPHRIWGGSNANKKNENKASSVTRVAKSSTNKMNFKEPILNIPALAVNISDSMQSSNMLDSARFVVIDNTEPRLKVIYDNNTVYGGKYFKANRSARVIIDDDSFAFSYLLRDSLPIATVKANGKQVINLTAQQFKNDSLHPNIWYADISFNKDASWEAKYAAQDLSGNFSSSRSDNFVIDTRIPTVSITGVSNGGAYSRGVKPTVVISDNYLNPKSVKCWLHRVRGGQNVNPASAKFSNNSAKVQYEAFYSGPSDDDIYQLQWSAKDVVNHEIHGSMQFSINSSGSTFRLDGSTAAMNNKQLQHAKDVRIEEVNASSLAYPAKVSVVQDGVERNLSKNDFSVSVSTDRGWPRLTYTIFQRNFADNANYRVLINSVDKAGNHSSNERVAGESNGALRASSASLRFTVDNLAPLATAFDMRKNSVYKTEKDGKLVRISAKDNMALKLVSFNVDGKAKHIWRGKSANKPVLSLKMKPDGVAHDVLVKAVDYAGNITELRYNNVKVVQISHSLKKISALEKKKNGGKKDNKNDDVASSQVQDSNANNANKADSNGVSNNDLSSDLNDKNTSGRSSSNLLVVLAYVGIIVVALLCVALGAGIIYKKHKSSKEDD
ncbi:hypothetical protein ACMZ7O_04030 [Gardnerella greenwoodii]|uniref:hypothetical protein n=1 Tax=Gardnerella greenwoodii TaxID=2914925 RepID=UPI0002DE0AC2|nr:hypothetical protein [Gardnerella greenwoodii]